MYKSLNAIGLTPSENNSVGLEGGPGNPNGVYNAPRGPAARRTDMNYAYGASPTTGQAGPTTTSPSAQPPANAIGYSPQQMQLDVPSNSSLTSNSIATMEAAQKYALDPNSAFMQNARQEGLEFASKRGLLNSSIAAGNSQRAAIQASQPIANAVFNDANNSRDFYRAAKLLPLQSALELSTHFADMAAEQPDVYTPEYINGMTNFFMSNMQNVMKNFFGAEALGTT